MNPSFQEIWQRIIQHAEPYEKFSCENQSEFSYRIVGNAVYPEGQEHGIFKSQFEQIFQQMPFQQVSNYSEIKGYTFIYAILTDKRIRRKDW